MADLQPLQSSFTYGMKRDQARHQIREGSAWNMVNVIPDLGAPARKRGGWTYYGDALGGSSSYVEGALKAPFVSGSKLVIIDEDGRLKTTTGSTITDVGTAVTTKQNPIFHRDLAIILDRTGMTIPKRYDGSAISALSATAPTAKLGNVHKDYTVLANTPSQPQRLFFSPPGNPTDVWDVNSYWDASFPVTGLASLRTAQMVFSAERVERLRGSIPPTTTGLDTDFQLEPHLDEGCQDARSIALYGEDMYFANKTGVWQSDGAVADNIVRRGGIEQYWVSMMSAYDSATWTVSAGIFRGHYIVAVMNGSTFIDCLACDVQRYVWYRLGNMTFSTIHHAEDDELYLGLRDEARMATISSLWTPSSSVKNDADGTAVLPTIETRFFRGDPGFKRWSDLYVGYDVRDAAADAPRLEVSTITSPEATSYTALSETLPATSQYTWARVPLNVQAHGVGFKIMQANASADTYLYDLAAQVEQKEPSRIA